MNVLQLLGAIEIGLIYALVAMGIYITFVIIDFPDLTVDGSFTLGAAVSGALIASGYDPWLATFFAVVAGGMSGYVTGYMHIRLGILGLLASILTMTALYSINLRIMGRPNIALFGQRTIFSEMGKCTLASSAIIVCLTALTLTKFFTSNFGLKIRAIGMNPRLSQAYGISVERMKITALSLSNGLVSLAGSMFTQSEGFVDISMGTGTIVVGLASVIIGRNLLNPKRIFVELIACILGSILYRIMISAAINVQGIGLAPSDLNLITAVIVCVTMILPKIKRMRRRRET